MNADNAKIMNVDRLRVRVPQNVKGRYVLSFLCGMFVIYYGQTLLAQYSRVAYYLNVVVQSENGVVTDDAPSRNLRREMHTARNASAATTQESSMSVCSLLGDTNPLQFWILNLPQILEASKSKLDRNHDLAPVEATILEKITPRLPYSVKKIPHDELTPLIEKFERRWKYLNDASSFGKDDEPPIVTVLVLGGSVTAGINCKTGIHRLWDSSCSWPQRLQDMIDQLSVPNLVKVHTMAIGGTNTAMGTTLLKYDLPPGGSTPDVLINAYSTNDMHILTMLEAESSGITVRDRTFEMAQEFVRTATKCKETILFWLDDYLGNEQREILSTQQLSQSIHVLSNYYGFGFVSYADAVRDWVYSDARETMFSPAGWYKSLDSEMVREIHPGQGMHLSVAYMMIYNFLNAAAHHCAAEKLHQLEKDNSSVLQTASRQLDAAPETVQGYFPKSPGARPATLPPPLDASLSLQNVTELWHQADSECPKLPSNHKRCPFAWMSGVPWLAPQKIEALFRPLTQHEKKQGWHVYDDTKKKNKYGWGPVNGEIGETLTLEFNEKDHAADKIQAVTFFFLKSYGPKWENSTVTVTVERQIDLEWRGGAIEDSCQLSGIHAKETSEMYTETLQLSRAETKTTALRVKLTQTGGTTFKLMGIAACQ